MGRYSPAGYAYRGPVEDNSFGGSLARGFETSLSSTLARLAQQKEDARQQQNALVMSGQFTPDPQVQTPFRDSPVGSRLWGLVHPGASRQAAQIAGRASQVAIPNVSLQPTPPFVAGSRGQQAGSASSSPLAPLITQSVAPPTTLGGFGRPGGSQAGSRAVPNDDANQHQVQIDGPLPAKRTIKLADGRTMSDDPARMFAQQLAAQRRELDFTTAKTLAEARAKSQVQDEATASDYDQMYQALLASGRSPGQAQLLARLSMRDVNPAAYDAIANPRTASGGLTFEQKKELMRLQASLRTAKPEDQQRIANRVRELQLRALGLEAGIQANLANEKTPGGTDLILAQSDTAQMRQIGEAQQRKSAARARQQQLAGDVRDITGGTASGTTSPTPTAPTRQRGESDADYWERLVKAGVSKDQATFTVKNSRGR